MSKTKPKINLLYYKNILDRCMLRFFEDFTDKFLKDESGKYVFSNTFSATTLKKVFLEYITEELKKYVVDFSETDIQYYFIIGSCIPGENIILTTFRDDEYFPGKFKKIIELAPDIRYFLKESDIHVDMRFFNGIFEELFSDFMTKKGIFGKHVFFIRHRHLDCYMMFKTIKLKYNGMVVNLHKKHSLGEDRCIFSINENIDNYSHRKLEILKSNELLSTREEVYQYIDGCLGGI